MPDAELEARAQALAEQMASAAKGSNGAVKKLLLASFGTGLEEQMELEGRLIAECADSADGREGIDAFLNKRSAEVRLLEAVLLGRERAGRHLVGVLRCSAAQFVTDIAEPLDELGGLAAGEPGHVLPDQHLGVAVRARRRCRPSGW